MPSRNTLKTDVKHSYYHIYTRGASKQPVFIESADYSFFLNLFARYLSQRPAKNKSNMAYPHYAGKLELLTYCLMDNHFHLLIYQVEEGTMSAFMRSLMTSYSRYFNRKYKRTGSLFESRYKASRINANNYLQHISRYVHLNPRYWRRYKYSSLSFYEHTGREPEWLLPGKVLDLFTSRKSYMVFVADYEEHKQILDEIKYELADT